MFQLLLAHEDTLSLVVLVVQALEVAEMMSSHVVSRLKGRA